MKFLSFFQRIFRWFYNRYIKQSVVIRSYYEYQLTSKAHKGYIQEGEMIYVIDRQTLGIYDGQKFHPWPPKSDYYDEATTR